MRFCETTGDLWEETSLYHIYTTHAMNAEMYDRISAFRYAERAIDRYNPISEIVPVVRIKKIGF